MSKRAVLVLAYNRPDLTEELIKRIAAYAPEKLYVACDGPKSSTPGDLELVMSVREHLSNPGWQTDLHTRFLSENHGLRQAVAGAISWFFSMEPEGIILEDDCHPEPDFFRLAEHVLDRYRDNEAIWGMTGSNNAGVTFPDGASYGFIRHPLIWGWATWANRWQQYDSDLATYSKNRGRIGPGGWPSREHKLAFQRHLDSMVRCSIPDSWGYPWTWTVMSNGGLWVVPVEHLVENVGFRDDATHTTSQFFSSAMTGHLDGIQTPKRISSQVEPEREILRKLFFLQIPLWINYPIGQMKRVKMQLSCLFGRKFSVLRNRDWISEILRGNQRDKY